MCATGVKNAARFFAFPPRRFGLGLTLDRAFLVFTLGLVGELGADGLVKAGHLVLGDSDVLFDFAFLLTGRTETAAGTHQGLDFGVAALEGKTTEAETFQRNVAALFEELFPEEERKKKNLSMNVERSHTGRHKLTNPFFVLATQNPIEQEGTYPLPEAQQDRFMFKVFVNYPSFSEEFEIARRTTSLQSEQLVPVLSGEQILELQTLVRKVPVADHIIRYCLALVRQTRITEGTAPKFVKDWLSWGAGPRAVQNLILGAKARALLYGRAHVTTDDIAALAAPVLRHRILTNFTAASEGVTTDTVVKKLLSETPSKQGDLESDPRFARMFTA